MTTYHQNPSYHHQTGPTEHLYQNYGFSPAYDQQHRVPRYPTCEEYLRQPAVSPYPTLPPLQQQPSPVSTTHIHVQPAPVRVAQQPPRIVFAREPEDEPNCCLVLCCACTECVCSFVSSVLGCLLAIVVIAVGLGLAVYFFKYYNQ